MRFCHFVPILAAPLLLTATGSFAKNLLNCIHSGSTAYGCSLNADDSTIVTKQDFQFDFAISYTFPCSGNVPQLAFFDQSTGSQDQITFTSDGSVVAHLTGLGPVTIRDLDAETTSLGVLIGACQLEVSTVSQSPSLDTLAQWRQQATDMAKILTLALKSVERDQSLVKIITWDADQLQATDDKLKTQLQDVLPSELTYGQLVYPATCDKVGKCGKLKDEADMPSGWDLAVALHPELPDLVALRAQVESISAGRPPVYAPTDLTTDEAELTTDVTTANDILSRADKYLTDLDTDTRSAVNQLQKIHDKASPPKPAA